MGDPCRQTRMGNREELNYTVVRRIIELPSGRRRAQPVAV
jgi:hypothetical protein